MPIGIFTAMNGLPVTVRLLDPPLHEFVPHDDRFVPDVPAEAAARAFFEIMRRRRTVREYSDEPVDRSIIEWIVRAAEGTVLPVEIAHDRAGTIRTSVTLG